jgi:TBC1 domain family member 20
MKLILEISDRLRSKLQDELIDLIAKILIKNDNLHYYQGYHDIALTLLLVTGVDSSLELLESITLSHLT